ncbi:T9SS type A sorting domain-containing protein [Dyadobacter tibetensis]|uniref:T9SS type A sorting domain-containing protein n=1 Tax=Dyadobacter tibetensis TaxID=1211851 RepID=UPI000471F0EA|nr:T9SS type A sorting domain-containing protein [Dyadobacter tibetensis]
MKTNYFYTLILSLLFSSFITIQRSKAQCNISQPGVVLRSTVPQSGYITMIFDLSFTIERNNGNKFAYFHLWTSDNYPDLDYGHRPSSPEAADLVNSLATIVINTDDSPASLVDTYLPDDLVIPLTGMSIHESEIDGRFSKITIKGITISAPAANGLMPALKGDTWASQAANGKIIHCYQKGLGFMVTDPMVTGRLNCQPAGVLQRSFNLSITTLDPEEKELIYKVYVDNGSSPGILDPGDELVSTSNPFSIKAGSPLSLLNQPFNQIGKDDKGLWIEVDGVDLPNAMLAEFPYDCQALPVNISSFKGELWDNRITLYWQTTQEYNSKYFNIQRSRDASEFISIGSIDAQGDSRVGKSYQFADSQPVVGHNYYRLQIVDRDGSIEYSRILSIDNAADATAFQLLGNPVQQEIRFLLKNANSQGLRLTDLSGRQLTFELQRSGTQYTLSPDLTLIPGIYLLSLPVAKRKLTKKIVVGATAL